MICILFIECSLGYYGSNCAFPCKKCFGGFRCNSVTGSCPKRLYCHGQFKGELCELGTVVYGHLHLNYFFLSFFNIV